MRIIGDFNIKEQNNFIFIGEAGSGKSEIAINFSIYLKEKGEKEVHFFDMDMTKPLFRSRDIEEILTKAGVIVHFEEQFMDAPTLVGGVNKLLKDENVYVVMDVGGDYIGARAIGGFAPQINKNNSIAYYVINPYRPWANDLDHIDLILGEILGVSHINIDKLHLISNPNLGKSTTIEEVIEGHEKLEKQVGAYKPLELLAVEKSVYQEKLKEIAPIMILELYLEYSWTQEIKSE